MEHFAHAVVDAAGSVLTRLKALDAGPLDPCKKFICKRARIDRSYFKAIQSVCDGVLAYVEGSEDVSSRMTDAINKVKEVEGKKHLEGDVDESELQRDVDESELQGDVYESELRSHRVALTALREAWPRLRIDEASVIYCYPFALPWADPVSVIEAADIHGRNWVFAGQSAKVQITELTDMWNPPAKGTGRFPEDRYTGVSLSFPECPVVKPPFWPECVTFEHLEIRLSSLGNHYLRLGQWLEGASIHDLNQAMRRPMREMGTEVVEIGKDPYVKQYDRVADLAEDLINSLVRFLEPDIKLDEIGEDRLTNKGERKKHKRHKKDEKDKNEKDKNGEGQEREGLR